MLGRQILSPLDLERTFRLIGGDILQGGLSLDQLYRARSMPGYTDYRGPLPGCTCAVRRRGDERRGPQCSA